MKEKQMSKEREALKLALEALENAKEICIGLQELGIRAGKSAKDMRVGEVLIHDRAITAIREALAQPQEKYQYGTPLLDAMTGKASEALDRMAENARELGLDYEPPCKTGSQCTSKCQQCEQPAQQQEPVAWGVDWGKAGDQSCVSIIKRLPGGGIEVLATEYGPPASKPWVGLTDEERRACTQSPFAVENYLSIEAKLKEKNT